MLKPFYQGKLDAFCAMYSVLNALRLTHGIRTSKARDILNDTLLGLSLKPAAFRAVLTQETDYLHLVDTMLAIISRNMSLEVIHPFASDDHPTVDVFWNACQGWLGEEQAKTAVIFRFLRHLKPDAAPVNRHWTTADYLKGDILHLFDCSHEAEAILNIRKNSFVTKPEAVDKEHLLYIQPDSVRFVRLPFSLRP